ncbi:DUF58 domain-containing protein [Streptomyces sp. NPDC054783]
MLLASTALAVVAASGVLAFAGALLLVALAPRPSASIRLDTPRAERHGIVTVSVECNLTRPLLRTDIDLGVADTGLTAEPIQMPTDDIRSHLAIALRTHRHGEVIVGPPTLGQTDPFGLCRRTTTSGDGRRLLVRPRMVAVGRLLKTSRIRSSAGGRGTPGDGGDYDALRAYEPGDDHRLIHWPNSARTGQILVRRQVASPTREFVILHDTAPAAHASPDDFEEAVDFSASVVTAVTRLGHALRLATTTSEGVWSWSGGERCTPDDIARVFASIQPAEPRRASAPVGTAALRTSVRRALMRSATCTVVTGEPSAQLLQALEDSVFPMRLILVCLGPSRPSDVVMRWAQPRGTAVIDSADARGAAVRWSMLTQAAL